MEFIQVAYGKFVSEACAQTIFVDGDYLNNACVKLTISKILGVAIVLGSIIVKAPQIFKFVKNKSCEGVSFVSQIQELASYSFALAYNYYKGFPFSTWGEIFFISIQLVAIVSIMMIFNKKKSSVPIFLTIWTALMAVLTSGNVPPSVLNFLYSCTIPLTSISRLMQIRSTFKLQSTGQLAFLTCLLNLLGSSARIFNVLQEVDDPLILISFISATTFNAIIIFQFWLYWTPVRPIPVPVRGGRLKAE